MNDVQLVQVLNPSNYLMKELDCKWLFDSLVLDDKVKKFPTLGVLHYKVKLFRRLYDFVKLNDVWMSNHFEYMNFTSYSFNVVNVLDFVFF